MLHNHAPVLYVKPRTRIAWDAHRNNLLNLRLSLLMIRFCEVVFMSVPSRLIGCSSRLDYQVNTRDLSLDPEPFSLKSINLQLYVP